LIDEKFRMRQKWWIILTITMHGRIIVTKRNTVRWWMTFIVNVYVPT
jgi:hypothetical protein